MSVLDDFKKKGKTILEVKHIIKNESDTGAADKVTVWDCPFVCPYHCVLQTFCLLRLENCYYIFIDLSVSLKDNLIITTILLN